MRERLVAAFVGLTVVVVVLFGIPRAYSLADLVRSQEQARVDRTADLVATVVDERHDEGRPVDAALVDGLAADGESIVVRSASGRAVSTDGATTSDDDVRATAALTGGGSVTVTLDGSWVDSQVGHALLPLALLGLLLALVAAAAGLLLADRFARPFRALADAARGLGAGQLHPDLPDFRVPEARAIAEALTTSGERLDRLLAHERDLVVHASHELRTPVTALRLGLEDLRTWPETTPAVARELERSVLELDRLSMVIGDLLDTSRELSAAAQIDLDLDALVARAAAATGRSVTHDRAGPVLTRLDPVPVVEALQLLLLDGSRVAVADRSTHLEIAVTGAADISAAAEDLVAAVGGLLTGGDGTALIRLPKRPVPGSEPDLVP